MRRITETPLPATLTFRFRSSYDPKAREVPTALFGTGDFRIFIGTRGKTEEKTGLGGCEGFQFRIFSALERFAYPQHLLRLRDGRLLMSYGYRRQPWGVRACLSSDNGKTWDMDNEIVIRMDGGTPDAQPTKVISKDLGYPVSVQLADGRVFTVYYFNPGGSNFFIAGTFWELPKD